MRVKAMWLPVVGLSICLIGAIPAAAQGGRGMGKGAGGGMSPTTSRPEARPPSQPGANSSGRMQPAAASQVFETNPQLSSRLQPLLPPGTILTDAATGFKNSGQFIAAVHVSNNLGFPFENLKKQMLAGDSLGKAIRTLKPDLPKSEVNKEVKKAEAAAKDDLKATAQRREQQEAGSKANTTTP